MEVYECGTKFDFNSVKIGDRMICCDRDFCAGNSTKYNYSDDSFVVLEIKSIDTEKGIIELNNGFKYKQYYETVRPYAGYKEVEYMNYLKATREPDFIMDNIIPDNIDGIRPFFAFKYDDMKDKMNRISEKRNKEKEIEARKEMVEKLRNDMRKPFDDEYDSVIDPLVKELDRLHKELNDKRYETFMNVFCKNCKNNHNTWCTYTEDTGHYETEMGKYNYDNNGTIEVKFSRPSHNCVFFCANGYDFTPTPEELKLEYKFDEYNDIRWRKNYEDYLNHGLTAYRKHLDKKDWEMLKKYYTENK